MIPNLKLSMRIYKVDDAIPIHMKPDGKRFEHAYTIKFNKDTEHVMMFNFRPATCICKLMVNGEMHKLEFVKGKNDEDADGRTYKTLFTTKGFQVTKSGKRQEILIVIELENGVYMKLALQCKVYAACDKIHAQWGDKLSMIDMDCSLDPSHNYVTILKEKYL